MNFLSNFFTSVTIFISSLFGNSSQAVPQAVVAHHEQPFVQTPVVSQSATTTDSVSFTQTEPVKTDTSITPESDEKKSIVLTKQDLRILSPIQTALENYKWDKKHYPQVISDLYPIYYPNSGEAIPEYVQSLYDQKSKNKLDETIEKLKKGQVVTLGNVSSGEVKNPSKLNYTTKVEGGIVNYKNQDYGFSLKYKKHLVRYEPVGFLYQKMTKTQLFEFDITDGGTVAVSDKTKIRGNIRLFVQPKSDGCVNSSYQKQSSFMSNGQSFDTYYFKEDASKTSAQIGENLIYITENNSNCYIFSLYIIPMPNSSVPSSEYIESIKTEALDIVKSLVFDR